MIMFNVLLFTSILILCSNIYWIVNNTANYPFLLTHWNWMLLLLTFISLTIDCKLVIPRVKHGLVSCTVTLSLFVSILYWILLSKEVWGPESPLSRRIAGCYMHSLNLVIASCIKNTTKIEIQDSIYSSLIILVYTTVILVGNQFGLKYPYGFLDGLIGSGQDLNLVRAMGFVLGIIVVVFMLHYLVCKCCSQRQKSTLLLI